MIHETVRSQNPLVSMADDLNRLTTVKKLETISLLDYVARFKQNNDVMKCHLGKSVLVYFKENNEPYINGKDVLFENDQNNML